MKNKGWKGERNIGAEGLYEKMVVMVGLSDRGGYGLIIFLQCGAYLWHWWAPRTFAVFFFMFGCSILAMAGLAQGEMLAG